MYLYLNKYEYFEDLIISFFSFLMGLTNLPIFLVSIYQHSNFNFNTLILIFSIFINNKNKKSIPIHRKSN